MSKTRDTEASISISRPSALGEAVTKSGQTATGQLRSFRFAPIPAVQSDTTGSH